MPVAAADIEQSAPVLAAKTLLGAIEEAVAVLNRCREVDNSNAAIYNGLLVIFGVQNRPVIERLDVVLRGEGVRAGGGATYFLSLYSSIWIGAQEEVGGNGSEGWRPRGPNHSGGIGADRTAFRCLGRVDLVIRVNQDVLHAIRTSASSSTKRMRVIDTFSPAREHLTPMSGSGPRRERPISQNWCRTVRRG